MKREIKISFIGAGNVATHLAEALYKKGFIIKQVFSRTKKNAVKLALKVQASATNSLSEIEDTDLIIIAVPDDIITNIYKLFENFKSILAHTSGVAGINFLQKKDKARIAYFYPLQTFRKNQHHNLEQTPLFINARFESDRDVLYSIGSEISNNVQKINDEQKEQLHLSAVVVNNFVNHLFGLTKENLAVHGLDFSDLKPIIETTIERALNEKPFEIQTGPAIRNDKKTITKHLKLLEDYKDFQKVYSCLSDSIQNKHLKEI